MRLLLLSILIFPFYTQAFTGDSSRYLLPQDTLELDISSFNEKIISHYIAKGQTLYSLSKFYGLSVEELKYYNPGLLDGIEIGEHIQIPIPNRSIIRYPKLDFDPTGYVPIYYAIKRGDTYYGLSKRVMKMPIEELQKRLLPYSETLKVGQRLFVGWISIEGVPSEFRTVRGHPLFRKNQKLKGAYIGQGNQKQLKELQGAAAWDKNNKDNSDFFVLFDKVAPGAYVEIYYPMRGRKVFAKVLGPIPKTIYKDNIKLVASPLTTKLLGAKDDEFFVKVTYFKK